MSINSLANAAAARRPDFAPFDVVPQGLGEIASAATSTPRAAHRPSGARPRVSGGGAAPAPEAPEPAHPTQPQTAVNTALNVLFGYIPTEVLTLYVAVLAALHHSGEIRPVDWAVFWFFLAFTPLVVWLVFAAKVKAAGKELPVAPRLWPVWEMFAATLAYVAWASALPETPFTDLSFYSSAFAAIMVLVTSTLLGLLAPLFQRPLES